MDPRARAAKVVVHSRIVAIHSSVRPSVYVYERSSSTVRLDPTKKEVTTAVSQSKDRVRVRQPNSHDCLSQFQFWFASFPSLSVYEIVVWKFSWFYVLRSIGGTSTATYGPCATRDE